MRIIYLTRQEFAITQMRLQGLPVKDIAQKFKIRERTVKSHMNRVYRLAEIDRRRWHPSVRLCFLEATGQIVLKEHHSQENEP